jgi:spore maturation protein CgeB
VVDHPDMNTSTPIACGDGGPRAGICVPTARRFSRMAFQCGHLEAQDVLAECEDVDLLPLEAEPGFPMKLRWLRRLMYRDVSRRLAFVNPGLKRVRLAKDYDLLVVMCQGYWDFLYVNAIEGWQDHCRTSVCWIDELWAADLPRYRYWLPSLRRFDHIVLGMHGTVAPLSDMLGRRCHYVPGAVDTLRFSPYPARPERVVDVYSVGRRLDAVHQALLALAAKNRIFYQYDTLQTGISQAPDHREHRELYANIAKRSRCFMVAPGKANLPEETRGQIEVAFRYYEGAAAGAVMLGQAPDCEPFRSMFDWPDVVIPVKADGSDVTDVVSDLTAHPERADRIGRRNAREALLRHDWIHRWKRILEIAGVSPGPGIEGREKTLRELAELGRDR